MRPQLRPPFGPIAWAATFALLTMVSVPLVAQRDTARSDNGLASIAGEVRDSLHGGPLVGAEVMAEGVDRITITDSSGNFRMDSVAPGRYRFGVFHPVLDSIGASIASPPLNLIAGQTLEVAFGTPSPAAIVALVCGRGVTHSDTDLGYGSSLLMGRVLDAETEEPVAGVHVALIWWQMQASLATGVHRVRLMRDTISGPAGEVHFCQLPAGLNGAVRVVRDSGTSDLVARVLAMNGRVVGFFTLHVPGAAQTPSATVTGTDSPAAKLGSGNGLKGAKGGATLRGRVIGDNGAAVAGAQIKVVGSTKATATGDSGQFILRGLPTGTRTVVVRAVGWNPVELSVDLAARAPIQIMVSMGVKAAVLRAVIVTARLKAGYDRVGFSDRKLHGLGRFLDADEIDRRGATDLFGLLTTMPGMRLSYTRNGDERLVGTRGGNGCIAYEVDGAPYREMTPGDIDTFYRPSEIGAIEVYQPSEGPVQIVNSPGGMGCVTVVIWTKGRLGL